MAIKEKLIRVMSLNVVLWMLMLLALSGVLLCAGGIYTLLAANGSQVQAMLITGFGLIGLVVLLIALAVWASRRDKPAPQQASAAPPATPDNPIEHQLRPLLGNQATDWAKRHSGLATVGALSAGVILAASPRARAAIVGAAGPLFTRKAIQIIQQMTNLD
jgi:hypothetical protein